MADQEQSRKTQDPTPRRLREARSRGQVARSKDAVTAAMMVGVCVFFWVEWRNQWEAFEKIMSLSTTLFQTPFHEALDRMVDVIVEEFLYVVVPFALLLVIIGIATNILQFGAVFSAEPVKPQLNRVNPAVGVKKLFSLENFYEFCKTMLKVLAIALIAGWIFVYLVNTWVRIPWCGAKCVLPLLERSAAMVALGFTGVVILLGIFDLFIQRRLFLRQQRMTTDQVRREQKDTMGDPQVTGRRRDIQKEEMSDDLFGRIKQSTILVYDHSRRAVALEYRQDETPLPVVKAIGRGDRARLMLDIANEAKVRVARNDGLTETLCDAKIDHFIPSETIEAVARLLRQEAAH